MIPFLYAFMTHKNRGAYVRLFDWFIHFAQMHGLPIRLRFWTIHFESRLIPAIFQCFIGLFKLGVEIYGCFFQVNELGLSFLYNHHAAFIHGASNHDPSFRPRL